MKKFLIFFLLISVNYVFALSGETNKFLKMLSQDLSKSENKEAIEQYNYLMSLGWKFFVVKQKQPIVIRVGDPFSLKSFSALKKSQKDLVFFVRISEDYGKIISRLKKTYFPKAVKSKVTTKAWKMKYAASVTKVKRELGDHLVWPYDNVDALGEGWGPVFKKIKPNKTRLNELCIQAYGQLKGCDRKYVSSLYSYWNFKPNKKIKTASEALESILAGERSSGCLIGLNTFMHLSVFYSYGRYVHVFDNAYKELKINNLEFNTTKLFPNRVTIDNDGSKKAKLGRWGLIGHGAYIRAIMRDSVTDQDYAGENIIITDTTGAAAKNLVKQGLGFYQEDIMNEEFLEEAMEDYFFYGFTYRMIKWWQAYHKKYMKYLEEVTGAIDHEEGDLEEDVLEDLHKKALKNMDSKAKKLLNAPFLTKTKVWGHPAGEQTLANWLKELALRNPHTPYGIHIYDYHLGPDQCTNYVDAFMSISSEAKKVAISNCKKIN